MDDGVLLLDVLDNPPDEPLGAFRRRVDGDKSEGTDRLLLGHGELLV